MDTTPIYAEYDNPAISGTTRETFLHLLSRGYPLLSALEQSNITYDTFRYWMVQGADPEKLLKHRRVQPARVEPYWTFARDVRNAIEQGKAFSIPGPPRGRKPSAISSEQEAVILDCVRRGWSFPASCHAAGITLTRLGSWLRLGGYSRQLSMHRPVDPLHVVEPYKSFVKRFEQAEDDYFATTN